MGSVELSDLDWSDSTSTRYLSKTVPGMKPVPSKNTLPNLTAEQYRTITWNAGLTNNHDGIAVSNDDNASLLLYKSSTTPEPSGRIVYELITPIKYALSPIQVFALLGYNNVWADTGNASVTYRTGKVALLSDVADATEPIQKRIDIELDDDTETVSGAVATFETELTQVPTSIRVNIDLVQAGSGDPSPSNTRLISGWENCQVWVQPEYDASADPAKTISLGRTVYSGTLDVLKGKLIVNKAMVMLNVTTSQISLGTTNSGVNYASILYSALGISLSDNKEVQSSNYVQIDSAETAVEGVIKCYAANFRIYDSRFNTKDNAKAILDNVQVVYPLEQPIEYDIGGSIITAFSGQNAMWANTGDISVTYRTGKFALLSDEANAMEISEALINSKTAKDIPYQGAVGGIAVTNVKEALDFLPTGSDTAPNMDANPASAGFSSNWSRSDHKHPSDTSRVPITRKINDKPLNDDLVLYWSCEITLSLSWSGNGPWTQSDLEISIPMWSGGISSNSSIILRPTAAQISQLITDGVTVLTIENNNGTLTAYAFGATPSTAMTIACTVMEVSS